MSMRVQNIQVRAPERQAIVVPFRRPGASRQNAIIWLDRGIFGCLCVLAAVTLESAVVARWMFWVAMALWLVKWIVGRRIFRAQPLIAPLCVFLVLLGIATSLSYAPLLS